MAVSLQRLPAKARAPLEIARLLTSRRMLVALLMGFSSGLPLLLVGTLLQAWLTLSGISIKTIGLFTLVGLPYTLKFVWAPIFDRYRLPFLGRRRGWLLTLQVITALAIAGLGAVGVGRGAAASFLPGLGATVAAAFLVTFFSASQDTMIDAYRRESLGDDREQALGASLYTWGYRFAMIFTSGAGLVLAYHIAFDKVFYIMAGCMGVGMIATLIAREPPEVGAPRSLLHAIVDPFIAFFRAHGRAPERRSGRAQTAADAVLRFAGTYWPAIAILAFILLYKLGDALASTLATPFFLKMGFNTQQIGLAVKLVGFWALMGGILVGGLLIVRLGMIRGLLLFGIFQGATTATFAWLTQTGPDTSWLAGVISLVNFADGMGTAALIGFMATLTDRRFTATQFALLTALFAVPRVILSSFTGFMADSLGWAMFFIVCALAAIPGLLLIPLLPRRGADKRSA